MANAAYFENGYVAKLAKGDAEIAVMDVVAVEQRFNYTKKSLTDEEINSLISQDKEVTLSGDTLNWEDRNNPEPHTPTQEEIKESAKETEGILNRVSLFLASNTNSEWTDFYNKLKAVDFNNPQTYGSNFISYKKTILSIPNIPQKDIRQLP